jgi:hypothetical protein
MYLLASFGTKICGRYTRGWLSNILYGNAVGTKVSGVPVKRGSAVIIIIL